MIKISEKPWLGPAAIQAVEFGRDADEKAFAHVYMMGGPERHSRGNDGTASKHPVPAYTLHGADVLSLHKALKSSPHRPPESEDRPVSPPNTLGQTSA